MDFERFPMVERYQQWQRLRTIDREAAKRNRPTTPKERIKIAQRVIRFIEDNEDTLVITDSEVAQEHTKRGQQRKQSAFAATQFVNGETGFYTEQIMPVIHSLLDEGFLDRSENFAVLKLTDDGRRLFQHFHEHEKYPEYQDRLPWLKEGWTDRGN